MVTPETVKKIAFAFDEAEEKPHFHRTSFRIRNKIFATMDKSINQVVVMLSAVDQSVFCDYDRYVFYPVPGGWGRKGATIIELKRVRKDMLVDAMTTAYCKVAPKKLAEKYLPK